jgi:glucose/arabinose dehydrogenase/lysophospholipase L1-like esterase
MTKRSHWLVGIGLALLSAGSTASTQPAPFALQPNDHICIVGNTLAERMQFDGYLETQLHARFPRHDLVIRNLAVAGDEVNHRLRQMNFGTPDEWLSGQAAPVGGHNENRLAGADTKADVILAFFGYNESYAGQAGLEAFKKTLDDWVGHTLAQKYNGRSSPRLVLISPIAHENLRSPDLPDGQANNERLALYTQAMKEVAAARSVRFVDLFTPTRQAYASAPSPFTSNGVHLTAVGNRRVAEMIDRSLFGAPRVTPATLLARIRQAVIDKNTYWYNRYRVTDGYSTYGERAFLTFIKGNPRNVNPNQVTNRADVLPSNYESMQRELTVLDVMTSNRDRRIWAIARGRTPAASALSADDADTPAFIDAGTNQAGTGPDGAHMYLTGDTAIEKMTPGKGLKIELFASEREFPELANPVQIAFDTKGRLWVASWKSYPHWQPKTPMDDKLVILEDTNADGRADRRTVFAGDLHNPTGFEFYNGGVILAQAPNLLFLKDTNGDDKYDTKDILLSGFDTADTHHTINSFTFDPGGALYMQEGLFMRSQIETPWGPTTRASDGAVFRFEPRTSKLDVYIPMNWPNPHGHVFDEWGRDIVNDGTNSQPFYGPAISAKRDFPSMVPKPTAPKPGEIPGRSTGGTEILSSRHFPEDIQGNFLNLNVITHRAVMSFKLSEDGAGLMSTIVEPIVSSADTNFRPVDAEVGPDGALYVADWQDAVIGHMQHNLRDTSRDRVHGRIYRITAIGRPLLTPAKIDGEPIAALLDLLKEPENRVRYRAKIELSERNTNDVMAALQPWMDRLSESDPRYEHHLMEALWVRQWHNRVDPALLNRMLRSSEPWARAAATRVLCYWRDRVANPLALLKIQMNDAHPGVRLEAVRAASFFRSSESAALALESLNHPQDRFLKFALDQTMDILKPYIR